jgi:hypothetical protein
MMTAFMAVSRSCRRDHRHEQAKTGLRRVVNANPAQGRSFPLRQRREGRRVDISRLIAFRQAHDRIARQRILFLDLAHIVRGAIIVAAAA